MDSDATTVKRCERAERCVRNAAENLKSGDRLAGISSLRAALAHLEHHIDAADMTERNTLRDQLAYTCARSDIETECHHHARDPGPDGRNWWDSTRLAPEARVTVTRAIRYLELCNRLRRMEGANHIIQILDQPPPLAG